jgi:hypothetical protein
VTGFTLQQPWALLALLLAPALALLFRRARRQRAAWLWAYGGQRAADVTVRQRERRRGEGCVLAATVLLALALARPGANPHPISTPAGGRDVIFVLDVSRSMLGEDVHPSRLERAKLDILRSLDSLQHDRVGLVLFAGAAAIRCPLTTDYDFFRARLRDAGPDSVPRGSTYLELGLEKTADRMLATNRADFEDVILLTDGGDQGSHPEKAIKALNAARARLLVVGYGDPTLGARVPLGVGGTNGFLMDQGQEVWTRLDEAALQALAHDAAQGEYVRAGGPDFDLGRTYQEWSAHAPRQFLQGRSGQKYDEYYAWLLLPALALLLYPFSVLRRQASLLLLVVLLTGKLSAAESTNDVERPRAAVSVADSRQNGERAFEQGLALMHKKAPVDAAKAFAAAANDAPTAAATAVCDFNAGLAGAALAAAAPYPGAQLQALDAAIADLRRACLLRPEWRTAAQGLEVLYARREEAVKAMKAQQDQQNKMNQQAAALQKELERLLAEQKKLLAAGTRLQHDRVTPDAEKLASSKTLHVKQAELGQQTETVRGQMLSVRAAMRQTILKLNAEATPAPSADQIPTGFDEPLQHVTLARAAQDRAVQSLGPLDQLPPAVQSQQRAVNELAAALAALSNGQSGQDDQNSDDSDDSDTSDSSDSDNAASQSMPTKSDFLSDPVNRSLPKPNFSSEDILKEEQANARTRTKNQPARVGKGEKDW